MKTTVDLVKFSMMLIKRKDGRGSQCALSSYFAGRDKKERPVVAVLQ